ncbi:MAG: hypothetical protein Fues2KO_51950 [Fuerstiella sp.]
MIVRTNSQPRFLIAKHIPDLRRMEPRNIGVVVWADGQVCARFCGDDSKKPDYLQQHNSYDDWVKYWKLQLSRDKLRAGDGRSVPITTSEFLDELKSLSKQQYQLVEGGLLLDEISKESLRTATDHLFEELVAPLGRDKAKEPDTSHELQKRARKVINVSMLRSIEGYHERYWWPCQVGDAKQSFQFDYAIHSKEGPKALINRVTWTPQKIYSSAFQFEHMQKRYRALRRSCVSLVFATGEDLEDEKKVESWKLLSGLSKVINVADVEDAAAQLLTVVG